MKRPLLRILLLLLGGAIVNVAVSCGTVFQFVGDGDSDCMVEEFDPENRPGFAMKTGIYAAMLWCLFVAPLELQGERRVKVARP